MTKVKWSGPGSGWWRGDDTADRALEDVVRHRVGEVPLTEQQCPGEGDDAVPHRCDRRRIGPLPQRPREVRDERAEFAPVPGMGWMFVADPDGNHIELFGTL